MMMAGWSKRTAWLLPSATTSRPFVLSLAVESCAGAQSGFAHTVAGSDDSERHRAEVLLKGAKLCFEAQCSALSNNCANIVRKC